MKTFGIFLMLYDLNRLGDFPVKDRQCIVDRLRELIKDITEMIESDKGVLNKEHLKLEADKYSAQLKVVLSQGWQRGG